MAINNPWDIAPGFDWNEEMDFNDMPSWFLDVSHSWPPAMPMSSWFWMKHCSPQGISALSQLSTPTIIGAPKRVWQGGFYSALLIVRDKQEIKQREARHREVMRPFIEDFAGWWQKSKDELMSRYEMYKHFDLDKAENYELLRHLYDILEVSRRMWEIHYLGMEAVFSGWVMFEDLCRELLHIDDTSPQFLKLVAGFDTKIFQVDKQLWSLSKDAINRGLSDIFTTTKAGEVIAKLEEVESGKEWIKDLYGFLAEDGWRMQRMVGFDGPTWIEDPTPAIMAIQVLISQNSDFRLDEIRELLVREREKAIDSVLGHIPEDEKDGFLKLLKLAQQAGPFSEEHTYYCEMYGHSVIRRSLLGIGRRLAQGGTIDKSDDIFFINPDEIERVILTPEYCDLRNTVERRRKEWLEWHKTDRPMVITSRDSVEEALEKDRAGNREPISMKVVHGELPQIRHELEADFYGICGSPGMAEGPARVITHADQLTTIKQGDILIVPNIATSWTPYFTLIKGMVVDRGGTLGHASVVGREYAIPVVINIVNASRKIDPASKRIKTGQRIKVDGTQGVVYILD